MVDSPVSTNGSSQSVWVLGKLPPRANRIFGALLCVCGLAYLVTSIIQSDWWGAVSAAVWMAVGILQLLRVFAYADLLFFWAMGLSIAVSEWNEGNRVFFALGLIMVFCALMATIMFFRERARYGTRS